MQDNQSLFNYNQEFNIKFEDTDFADYRSGQDIIFEAQPRDINDDIFGND